MDFTNKSSIQCLLKRMILFIINNQWIGYRMMLNKTMTHMQHARITRETREHYTNSLFACFLLDGSRAAQKYDSHALHEFLLVSSPFSVTR